MPPILPHPFPPRECNVANKESCPLPVATSNVLSELPEEVDDVVAVGLGFKEHTGSEAGSARVVLHATSVTGVSYTSTNSSSSNSLEKVMGLLVQIWTGAARASVATRQGVRFVSVAAISQPDHSATHSARMEGAACPVCAHTFPDKKQRKEHVFQHHSEPTVRFAGVSEATVVRRDAGGFLSCECGRTVKTVGALRRHAKKCSGANRVDAPRSGAFANVCAVHGCSRAFTSRNALAVHVYESHSSPKTRFMASDAVAVIPRDPVTRYLHCPCGQYSVLSTAVMLRHTKKCRGVPLAEAPPDPTPLSAAVPQTKILAKENRMELFTTSRTPEVRNEPESVQLQQQRTPYELQVQHLLDPPSQSPQDVMSADQFLYELLSDPEQRRLMREMCIVVDENDRAIGADTKKNC
ncbi:hypothetical protein BC830DRAFT_1223421 [Chytriomyces sp. MP71]|nr:hypothetical protein BC830DRAFT_1223421 [Chytriomyces sp. MP71]